MISGTSSFFTPLALQKSWQGAAVKLFVFQQGHFLPCLPENLGTEPGLLVQPSKWQGHPQPGKTLEKGPRKKK